MNLFLSERLALPKSFNNQLLTRRTAVKIPHIVCQN